MKTTYSVTVKNKRYEYFISSLKGGLVYFECPAAGICQRFSREDVAELLIDLPTWILDYQADFSSKKEAVVRFRIKAEDKVRLEKRAHQEGYSNLSGFVRDRLLAA